MRSKTTLAATLLVFVSAIASAQSPNANPNASKADQAWADLQVKTKPDPQAKIDPERERSFEAKTAKVKAQADQAFQASVSAREFYARYPDHPQAREARKVEALSAIRSIQIGNTGLEEYATTIANTYINDKSYAAADRFDVSLAVERFKFSKNIKADRNLDTIRGWLKVGDDLKKEFGDGPGVQAYYLEVARRADNATAVQIATDVARSNAAAPAVHAEAQSIVDRAAMVGRPLPVRLPKIRGGEIDLGRQQGKITILVIWAPSQSDRLADLKAFSNGVPDGVQIVYLGVGRVPDVINAQGALPFPGANCYAPTGGAWKTVTNSLNLRYAPAPCVYVLNRAGNVVGIGRLTDLPALLQKALG